MKLSLLAITMAVAAGGAAADNVVCPFPLTSTGTCRGVRPALLEAGKTAAVVDSCVQIDEPDGTKLMVTTAGTADFFFEYKHDGGDFDFTFGACAPELLPAAATDAYDRLLMGTSTDAEADRLAFARECVKNDGQSAFQIFDDRVDAVSATKSITMVDSPVNLVFWIVPDSTLANFDPDAVYGNPSTRRPLFSLNKLNRDNLDHLVAFAGPQTTLFAWEDKERWFTGSAASDNDFGDLLFTGLFVVDPLIVPPSDIFYCDAAAPGGADGPTVCDKASLGTDESKSITLTFGPNGQRICDER